MAGNVGNFADRRAVCGFDILLSIFAGRFADSLEYRRRSRRRGAKEFSECFLPADFSGLFTSLFVILKQDIIQARFRVPAEQAEQVLSLKEISLRASVGMIDWCRLFCAVLLGTVSLLIVSPIVSPSTASALNISTWTNLVLLLAGMSFYLYRMVLASREIKSLTGQITFQTAEEMQGWTDGLFYYNRKDAAFMVEKPGGVGYTINFAHKNGQNFIWH